MRPKHPTNLNEEKVQELCNKFRDGEIMVNPFLDRLEKEGIPRWMGQLIVAGIQPVRGDYDKVKELCKQYSDNEVRVHDFSEKLEKLGIPCWVGFTIHDLHRKVRFLENIGKLDAEDQVIAHRMEKDREDRTKFFDQIEKTSKKTDPEAWDDLMDKIRGPSHCEHGRSWASNCYACEKIERTLFPDMFSPEEDED
jgi:hypothetical protein